MYMYMYMCIHVYIYTHTYTYVHTVIYIYIYDKCMYFVGLGNVGGVSKELPLGTQMRNRKVLETFMETSWKR